MADAVFETERDALLAIGNVLSEALNNTWDTTLSRE